VKAKKGKYCGNDEEYERHGESEKWKKVTKKKKGNKSGCVNQPHTQEPSDDEGGCYDGSRKIIPGCTCDSSCLTCGYTFDPTGTDDCITCADQEDTLVPVYSDGTGTCGQDPSDGDDDGGDHGEGGCYDGYRKLIPGCTCDSSCLTCGYMIDPTGTKDCIKCANQEDTLFPLYSDGTGICGQEPPNGDDDDADLMCDSSCLTCLFSGPQDCITCAEEDTLFPVYPDGTGTCGQGPPDGDDDNDDSDDGTGTGIVYCPDMPIKDYCDCSGDCGSSFCSCEEAKECCSS